MLYISDLDTLNRIRFKIYYYFVLRASDLTLLSTALLSSDFHYTHRLRITHHPSSITIFIIPNRFRL